MSTPSVVWNGFFQRWLKHRQAFGLTADVTPGGNQAFIHSLQWLLCLLMLVRFLLLFPMARTHTHTHTETLKPSRVKEEEKKKRMKRPSHSQTTDPWLSFENLRLAVKLSGLEGGQRWRSPAPGRSVSPASLQGLTRIFLSCQGRVMGAKENRGAQRSAHSQIWSLWNT